MSQIINNFLGIFILGIGEFLFAKIVLQKNSSYNKIKTFLVILVTVFICTLISTFTIGISKTILIFIIHMFEFKILFKLTYSKSMFLSFIYLIFLIISELIEFFIVTKIIKMNRITAITKMSGSIIGNITICFIFIILTVIFRKILNKVINTEISNNKKIIILSLVTLIPILLFFYSLIKEFKLNSIGTQSLISIIVLVTVLFSLIKQTIDNNKLTREYDNLLKFMTTYENEIEKQRILRHEIKNEFKTIRAKICDNLDNKEIIEYIDEIVKDKYKVNQEKYAKFGYLPQNGIKGLCYYKVQEAEEKGIDVALNISKRIQTSAIYDLNIKQQRDFGRILGVFLDNAIEASLESDKKQLGIEAYTNSNYEFKLIITNTYNNNIDKNKIGKESFSTKGNNRGHGLLLVKQLVQKHSIFELKTEIKDNLYSQMIIIRKQ